MSYSMYGANQGQLHSHTDLWKSETSDDNQKIILSSFEIAQEGIFFALNLFAW
jgi:hypothetical protein